MALQKNNFATMASNPHGMGALTLNLRQKFFGWLAPLVMLATAIGLFATWGK